MMAQETLPQYWVNRLSFALRKDLTSRFQENGIAATAEDWASLRFLSHGPQPTTAMSDATLRDRTTVSRLVDKLVAKGWVQRHPDAMDRRRMNLVLSPEGQDVLARMAALAEQMLAQTSAGISLQDQERTVSVLRKMFANLTQAAQDGEKDV